MTWFKTNNASVTNGGTLVTISDGANTAAVKSGDALIIGSFQPVEVKAVFAGQIELVEAWANSTQTGAAATAMPTSGDFKSATEALRNATKITQDNYKVIQDWGKETGTVTFTDYEGNTYDSKTMQQMEDEFDAQISQQESDYNDRLANLLSLNAFMRTENDMKVMRQMNDNKFAASGYVHMGQHADNLSAAVNQGLSTYTGSWNAPNTNRFWLGRGAGAGSTTGLSKLGPAVINIAGLETVIDGLGDGYNGGSRIGTVKFPEAPNGTVTCDSATGTVFDYSKEVDPRYGDVAPDLNEAVARAFEGLVTNGDFRLGVNHYFPQTNVTLSVNNGVALIQNTGSESGLNWVTTDGDVQPSTKYRVEVFVDELPSSGNLAIQLGGKAYGNSEQYLSLGLNVLEVETRPATIAGDAIYFGYIPVGTQAQVRSISVRPATDEVVTDRVDMWGFEGYLEQVTASNPYVYKYGLPQSQAADIDGVATSDSNRPDTYYAVFDGDTTSRGKGVDFLALSVLEQDAIASNPKNHIYRMKNGDICQWRVRQRTIAGAGNGDWNSLNAAYKPTSAGRWITFTDSTNGAMAPQGHLDELIDKPIGYAYTVGAFVKPYDNTDTNVAPEEQQGLYRACLFGGNKFGRENECYFLVCGTVPRLNQGAYVPSLNESGTSMCNANYTTVNGEWWFKDAALTPTTNKDCFIAVDSNTDTTTYGYAEGTGNIGSPWAARKDERFYDAIYAGGQGGVIDMRLSAWDASSAEKAAEIDAQVKAGTYRGMENLQRWVIATNTNPSSSSTLMYPSIALQGFRDTDGDSKVVAFNESVKYTQKFWVKVNAWNGVTPTAGAGNIELGKWYVVGYFIRNGQVALYVPDEVGGGTDWITAGSMNVVNIDVAGAVFTDISVSGEFTQSDVVGDPANILLTPQLKDGWLGSWVPVIPDGLTQWDLFAYTRKNLSPSTDRVRTNDLGVSWQEAQTVVDSVENAPIVGQGNPPTGRVEIWTYTAFAKQTAPEKNGEVLHGVAGVSPVMWVSGSGFVGGGVLLNESLLGKVPTGVGGDTYVPNYSLLGLGLMGNGKLDAFRDYTKYAPLDVSSTMEPLATQSICYQVSSEAQANIQYAFQEMQEDGTSWNDIGYIRAASYVETFTDNGGNAMLRGTAKLALPYGWVKNEI